MVQKTIYARNPPCKWETKRLGKPRKIVTLAGFCVLFKPARMLGGHREAVWRNWTYQQKRQPGRPLIDAKLEQRFPRVARHNPGLGYDKVKGELRKLGWRAMIGTP